MVQYFLLYFYGNPIFTVFYKMVNPYRVRLFKIIIHVPSPYSLGVTENIAHIVFLLNMFLKFLQYIFLNLNSCHAYDCQFGSYSVCHLMNKGYSSYKLPKKRIIFVL